MFRLGLGVFAQLEYTVRCGPGQRSSVATHRFHWWKFFGLNADYHKFMLGKLNQLLYFSFRFELSAHAGPPNHGTIGEFLENVIVTSHDPLHRDDSDAPIKWGKLFASFVPGLAHL